MSTVLFTLKITCHQPIVGAECPTATNAVTGAVFCFIKIWSPTFASWGRWPNSTMSVLWRIKLHLPLRWWETLAWSPKIISEEQDLMSPGHWPKPSWQDLPETLQTVALLFWIKQSPTHRWGPKGPTAKTLQAVTELALIGLFEWPTPQKAITTNYNKCRQLICWGPPAQQQTLWHTCLERDFACFLFLHIRLAFDGSPNNHKQSCQRHS